MDQVKEATMNTPHNGTIRTTKTAPRILLQSLIVIVMLAGLSGCLRYLTHDRSKVLLPGVDIDQTLKIASIEIDKGTLGCVLGVWAIRDQVIAPTQATSISDLYFSHIASLKQSFNIWHLTWAIADLYENGGDSTRAALQKAYEDAKQRAKALHGLADKFVNGDKIYMGDAHSLGRRYAETHVVVPGNKKYLQSFEEYVKKHPQNKKKVNTSS
jgi:hypothetical protein